MAAGTRAHAIGSSRWSERARHHRQHDTTIRGALCLLRSGISGRLFCYYAARSQRSQRMVDAAGSRPGLLLAEVRHYP